MNVDGVNSSKNLVLYIDAISISSDFVFILSSQNQVTFGYFSSIIAAVWMPGPAMLPKPAVFCSSGVSTSNSQPLF
jgi:hypothetical protein